MKKWNKTFLAMLCFCVILGVTACGTGDNMVRDEGTIDSTPEQNNTENSVNDENSADNMGNAVEDGVNNVENAIDDGVNAIGDGVEDITDDLTGNDKNVNDATEKPNN